MCHTPTLLLSSLDTAARMCRRFTVEPANFVIKWIAHQMNTKMARWVDFPRASGYITHSSSPPARPLSAPIILSATAVSVDTLLIITSIHASTTTVMSCPPRQRSQTCPKGWNALPTRLARVRCTRPLPTTDPLTRSVEWCMRVWGPVTPCSFVHTIFGSMLPSPSS